MKAVLRASFVLAALVGAFAARPSFANAMEEDAGGGSSIKCEKCTCNFLTGICNCTNCTISAS
jgi:hypothetical protein